MQKSLSQDLSDIAKFYQYSIIIPLFHVLETSSIIFSRQTTNKSSPFTRKPKKMAIYFPRTKFGKRQNYKFDRFL